MAKHQVRLFRACMAICCVSQRDILPSLCQPSHDCDRSSYQLPLTMPFARFCVVSWGMQGPVPVSMLPDDAVVLFLSHRWLRLGNPDDEVGFHDALRCRSHLLLSALTLPCFLPQGWHKVPSDNGVHGSCCRSTWRRGLQGEIVPLGRLFMHRSGRAPQR